MNLPYNLNLLDVVLLAIAALFALRGATRGFLAEVAGLVGLLGGVWVAGRYYGEVGRILSSYIPSDWSFVIGYVLILCAVMLGASLVTRGLHSFLKLAYADWLNHLAGAGIGILKGLVLCGVLLYLLRYFLADAEFMRTSRMAPVIMDALSWLMAFLPKEFRFGSGGL